MPESGSKAQPTGAEIQNGHYAVRSKGGVSPGTYRVEVSALRELKDVPPPDGELMAVEQFNSKSSLR